MTGRRPRAAAPMLSAVTRPQATQRTNCPGARGRSPTSDGGACAMGDTPVEVALSLRAQHAEGPLWDAATARLWWWTSPQSGCIAWIRSPLRSALEHHRAAGWRGARRDGRPGGGNPRAWRCSTGAQARWIYAFRSSRTGPRTAPTTARSTAGKGLGRHHGLRQAAGERVVVPRRRRLCDPMLDGLTISNGPAFDEPRGDSTSPTRPSASSTSST